MPTDLLVKPEGDLEPATLEDRETAIQRLQDEIANDAGEIIVAALSAPQMRKDENGAWVIPPEWLTSMSWEKAQQRAATAAAAWMGAKEAPVFLKIASSVFVGVTRARAEREGGNRTVNVSLVQIEVTPNSYPSLEVDNER